MTGLVFVTVGTDPQPFDRLLKEVEKLIEKKVFTQPVFCQTGYSTYQPSGAVCKPFLELDEFEHKIKQAELVITHGGAGSIGTALQYQKKCIAMPRLERFKEHANDHQVELVEALAKNSRIIAVHHEKELEAAIRKAANWKPVGFEQGKKIIELCAVFAKKTFKNP